MRLPCRGYFSPPDEPASRGETRKERPMARNGSGWLAEDKSTGRPLGWHDKNPEPRRVSVLPDESGMQFIRRVTDVVTVESEEGERQSVSRTHVIQARSKADALEKAKERGLNPVHVEAIPRFTGVKASTKDQSSSAAYRASKLDRIADEFLRDCGDDVGRFGSQRKILRNYKRGEE